ncbi:Transcriptional regulator ATRX, partial [Stegodyphus mimosarum]
MNGVKEESQDPLTGQTMSSKETCEKNSTEKIKNSDSTYAESDPVIEIPSLTGNQEIRRSQITNSDIKALVVRCTSCTQQINHFEPDKVRKHRRLNVIICKDCEAFYGCSDFSQDENGYYNYCTWCGNGGKLYLCDDCPNGFCSTCVRRNFGRAEVSKMNRDGWKCYLCNPKKLKQKELFYELIKSFSIKESIKKEKKLSLCTADNKNLMASKSWMTTAFDRTDDENKDFQKKINKLRNIETSHSKSLKHIVKKFEQLIVNHNSELKKIMKALLQQYSVFVNSKLKIDTANEQLESANCKKDENINVIDLTKDIESKDMDSKSNEDISILKVNETNEDVCLQEADGDKNNTSLRQDKSAEENASVEDSVLNSVAANEKTEVLDVNLKAKMALLDDSDSESYRKGNILSVSPSKSNDSENKLLKNDNKDNSKISVSNTSGAEKKSEVLDSDSDSKFEDDDDDDDKADEDFSPSAFESDKVIPNKKSKKKVHQKLKHLGSDKAISSSDEGSSSEKSVVKYKHERKVRKIISNIPDYDDPKLKLNAVVLVQKCDNILNGETSIKLKIDKIAELEKLVDRLCKSPVRSRKGSKGIKHTPLKERNFKAKRKLSESSSSISLSSSDESVTEKREKKHLGIPKKSDGPVDPNVLAKNELLQSDSESDALSSGSDVVKKKKAKKVSKSKTKSEEDSSDDFQPRRKKYCKLLREPVSLKDDESDTGEKNAGDKKKIKKDASKKRKQDSKESSSSNETSASESENDGSRKRKKNASKNTSKRQRIKKPAVSGSESDAEVIPGFQDTPSGKGRKNIKKIISEKNLAQETKEAQLEESERKKRVQERQKL